MPSAGVMASSVVSGVCTPVLREPFDNLVAWSGAGTIVAGRTGTAAQVAVTGHAVYTIPAVNESDTVTVGFAVKVNSLAAAPDIMRINSDANATTHSRLVVNTTGSIQAMRGAGLVGTASAAGVIAINTWYYVEIQAVLHDTAGAFKVNVNGATILNFTNVDTKAGGTKVTYDSLDLTPNASATTIQWDDLYLTTGASCAFQGDQVIPTGGTVVLNDPANNFTFAPWTTAGTVAITPSGNTGNGFSIPAGSAQTVSYDIPAPSQSAMITVSFWVRFTGGAGSQQTFMTLRSDAGATQHVELRWDSGGFIFGATTGALGLGSLSPAGTVPINTWCFIELTCVMGDSPNGYFQLKVNGAFAFTPPAQGVDTKNAGTKTVFDQIRFNGLGVGGLTYAIDDITVRRYP